MYLNPSAMASRSLFGLEVQFAKLLGRQQPLQNTTYFYYPLVVSRAFKSSHSLTRNMFLSTTTSVYLVDTRTTRKFVHLPAASTAQGRSITFKDYFGNASLSTFTISTIGLDRIDTFSNTVVLNSDFESIEVIAAGRTNWSIVNNYSGGLVASQRSSILFNIPNLSLWLDATDLSTMTTSVGASNDILFWGDKSSNAYSFAPVNSNYRSQRSTNCIVINQSTSHFLSQQNIPATQQSDFFCVLLDRSQRGPLVGLAQSADMMLWETDRRYHSQFFADGQETFTTLTLANTAHSFFIYQGNLYCLSETTGAISRYQGGGFTILSTATTTVSLRGGAVFDGLVYIPFNGGINVMDPNIQLRRVAPAFTSNFISPCVFQNEIYFANLTTTFPVMKFTPFGTTLTNVGNVGLQSGGRLIVYNGGLYLYGNGTGTFLQLYNGGNFWTSPFGQNYTNSVTAAVFSNTLIYNVASRLIEWTTNSGALFLASNTNNSPPNTMTPLNYRGRMWLPSQVGNVTFNYVTYLTGKNRGTQGSTEIVQVNTQLFYFLAASVVYDGSLFIGRTTDNNIIRYGNGATVDVNVSSVNTVVAGLPRIVMVRKNQTNCGLWVNGVQLSNQVVNFTYSNQGAQQMYIGGTAGTILNYYSDVGRDHMEGAMYEVLNYTSTLTTDDRQRVEGYLAWKYGIQTFLPVGHPYISFPPT